MSLAFLNIATNALLPLFFHMPIELGGLNLNPVMIGYAMGTYGLGTGMFQIFFFAKIVRRFGNRRTFIMSMAAFIPVFLMFPIISLLAKCHGVFWGVWVLVGVMMCLLFFMDTAYGEHFTCPCYILTNQWNIHDSAIGCIFIYVTESAPNRRSLGATNGLAQTTVSTARAIGPLLSTSLYSFSVRNNIVGGYGAYFVLIGISLLALLLAAQLPARTWASLKEEPIENDGTARR